MVTRYKCWCHMKGLVRNAYIQYESAISSSMKVMVKVFKSRSNFKVKFSLTKRYGTMWKILLQGFHMWHKTALPLIVFALSSRKKFLFRHGRRSQEYDISFQYIRPGSLKRVDNSYWSSSTGIIPLILLDFSWYLLTITYILVTVSTLVNASEQWTKS